MWNITNSCFGYICVYHFDIIPNLWVPISKEISVRPLGPESNRSAYLIYTKLKKQVTPGRTKRTSFVESSWIVVEPHPQDDELHKAGVFHSNSFFISMEFAYGIRYYSFWSAEESSAGNGSFYGDRNENPVSVMMGLRDADPCKAGSEPSLSWLLKFNGLFNVFFNN